jgi:hypothetical protein
MSLREKCLESISGGRAHGRRNGFLRDGEFSAALARSAQGDGHQRLGALSCAGWALVPGHDEPPIRDELAVLVADDVLAVRCPRLLAVVAADPRIVRRRVDGSLFQ